MLTIVGRVLEMTKTSRESYVAKGPRLFIIRSMPSMCCLAFFWSLALSVNDYTTY